MAYCDRCDRFFPYDEALDQHERDSSAHWICYSCNKDFASWLGLKEHYVQSPRHYYCQLCDDHFGGDGDFKAHLRANHHACASCWKTHLTEAGYKAHMRQKHHYCEPCDRVFASQSNLESHYGSSIHQPKDFRCPGAGCNEGFVSQSALFQHWEAGRCPSGMTRAKLNENVIRMDRNNLVTNPARLIGGPSSLSTSTTTMWATERSWNGHAYECFLCHKDFNALTHLNQHLASPKHQNKIYRCPNLERCGVEFTAISSLTQHVERDKCGVQRFKAVKDAMDSLSTGLRLLTV